MVVIFPKPSKCKASFTPHFQIKSFLHSFISTGWRHFEDFMFWLFGVFQVTILFLKIKTICWRNSIITENKSDFIIVPSLRAGNLVLWVFFKPSPKTKATKIHLFSGGPGDQIRTPAYAFKKLTKSQDLGVCVHVHKLIPPKNLPLKSWPIFKLYRNIDKSIKSW